MSAPQTKTDQRRIIEAAKADGELDTLLWYLVSDLGGGKSTAVAVNGTLPMPEKYAREMVADWMGASKTYTGSWDIESWFIKNLSKMNLHPQTRDIVSRLVAEADFGRILR